MQWATIGEAEEETAATEDEDRKGYNITEYSNFVLILLYSIY